MKRLFNLGEEATNAKLQALTRQWGAHVLAKIRVADVFEIEGSGISNSDYRFALQSHFDFVVSDKDFQPLFAVEFDGPSHGERVQAGRDALKARLCDRFGLPLLRVNARYFELQENGLDLLSWCVHAWFSTKAVTDAYLAGDPRAADVSPLDLLFLPGYDQPLPLFLSAKARGEIRELAGKHPGLDWAPSCMVGEGSKGQLVALAWLRVSADNAIWAFTGMRWGQLFHVELDEVVEHLAVMDLRRKLELVLVGVETAQPMAQLKEEIAAFKARYKGAGYSGLELL